MSFGVAAGDGLERPVKVVEGQEKYPGTLNFSTLNPKHPA